jgi:predicted histidine transporter YuiF (NhaC family)|tara:strand:- start:11475 stop:11699 length:225 start_codon:yes stop_codon:yes gene_type:complete
MASKSGLTTQKVVNYIKEKWQVFGVSALIIFILQLLSTKVIISALLGLVIAALLPSDTIKKVTKKITKEENGKN